MIILPTTQNIVKIAKVKVAVTLTLHFDRVHPLTIAN